MATGRARAKTEIGIVTSTKTSKTISVSVDRLVKHPKYGKYLRRRTRLAAHDENETANVGDQVEIAFTRPISKRKRWRFVRVVRSGSMLADSIQSAPVTDMGTIPQAATEDPPQEG